MRFFFYMFRIRTKINSSYTLCRGCTCLGSLFSGGYNWKLIGLRLYDWLYSSSFYSLLSISFGLICMLVVVVLRSIWLIDICLCIFFNSYRYIYMYVYICKCGMYG